VVPSVMSELWELWALSEIGLDRGYDTRDLVLHCAPVPPSHRVWRRTPLIGGALLTVE
jgi:hypothetical protein